VVADGVARANSGVPAPVSLPLAASESVGPA
jgi:hypothetical protein